MLGGLLPEPESNPEIRSELALQARVGILSLAGIGGLIAVSGLANSLLSLTTSLGVIPADMVEVAMQNQATTLIASAILFALGRGRWSLGVLRVAAAALVVGLAALLLRYEMLDQSVSTVAAVGFLYILVLALIPLRPIQAVGIGLGLAAMILVATGQGGSNVRPRALVLPVINGALGGLILSTLLYQVRRRFAEQQVATRTYAATLERTNRELEETRLQLVQSEKMASLGNLAAGVAHEINTPVGAIKANAHMTAKALDRLEAAVTAEDPVALDKPLRALRSATSVTSEATERIVKIVRSLKSFARLDEAELARTDLNACVRDTLPLLQHELRPGLALKTDLGDIPAIECHANQINQVVMNLTLNAIQAIEDAGTVTLRTRADERFVRLEVEDDGVGIPPENREKIFDPGFTTKGVGVGTGLGLSICYRIIRDHGGRIEVSSGVGHGTTMTVHLPLRDEARS